MAEAKRLLKQGDKQGAQELLRIGCEAGKRANCNDYGVLLVEQKKMDAALIAFQAGCEHHQRDACYNAGVALNLGGKPQEADPHFIEACSMGRLEACHNHANFLITEKHLTGAQEILSDNCEKGLKISCDDLKDVNAQILAACPKGQALTSSVNEVGNIIWQCIGTNSSKTSVIAWSKSGKKRAEGEIENGKLIGTWTHFNDDGSIKTKETQTDRDAAAAKVLSEKKRVEDLHQAAETIKSYCSCQAALALLLKQKAHDQAVTEETGVVDKVHAHSLGESIVLIREFLAAEFKDRQPASNDACTAKASVDALMACQSAAGKWKRQDLGIE